MLICIIYQALVLALPVTAAFESSFLHDVLYQQEFMDHFPFEVVGDLIVVSADKCKTPIAVKM